MQKNTYFYDFIHRPLPHKKYLEKYFRKHQKLTIFDIGCCEGEDTIRYCMQFPNSLLHSFEPIDANFEKSATNIRDAGFAGRVSLNKFALSDRTGTQEIYVSSGAPQDVDKREGWDFGNKSSSLLKPEKVSEVTPWLKFEKTEIIKTETLDLYCREHSVSKIDIVHMDVQGAEMMVLSGATETIHNISMIWLEVESVELYKNQPLREDIESFMAQFGFKKIMDTVDEISGDQLYVNKKFTNISGVIRKIKGE